MTDNGYNKSLPQTLKNYILKPSNLRNMDENESSAKEGKFASEVAHADENQTINGDSIHNNNYTMNNEMNGGNSTKLTNEVIEEQDLPSEITFEKRSIPKSRTQSVQSVLSSVSLRSFVQQHQAQQSQKQSKAFVPPQHSQPKHVNTSSYIQAPATTASSKRRASFEIGQRMPFNKVEDGDAVESDGELEINDQEQKRLTDEALRRLSSFSKFQPAEADFKKMTAPSTTNSIPKSTSAAIISSSFNNRPSSSPSLSRKPQFNQSSASQLREEFPKYSSTSTITPSVQTPTQLNSIPSAPSMSKTASTASSKIDDTSSLRTINDPKRPMYMPAVLRQSNTNLKPEDLRFINEQKNQNKFKSSNKNILNNAANSIKHQNWKFTFDGSNNSSNSTNGSTNGGGETMGSTFRQPTRVHWKKDLSRTSCAYCSKNFTFFERRHHCRRCGDIYCNEHVSNYLNLGADANFCVDSPGVLCKVCDSCFKDYEIYLKKKFGGNVINDSLKKSSVGIAVQGGSKNKTNLEQQQQQINVGSIPADWSWSSF